MRQSETKQPKWSKSPPEESGYFWMKCPIKGKTHIIPAVIFYISDYYWVINGLYPPGGVSYTSHTPMDSKVRFGQKINSPYITK
jgi:hypothetical protein